MDSQLSGMELTGSEITITDPSKAIDYLKNIFGCTAYLYSKQRHFGSRLHIHMSGIGSFPLNIGTIIKLNTGEIEQPSKPAKLKPSKEVHREYMQACKKLRKLWQSISAMHIIDAKYIANNQYIISRPIMFDDLEASPTPINFLRFIYPHRTYYNDLGNPESHRKLLDKAINKNRDFWLLSKGGLLPSNKEQL